MGGNRLREASFLEVLEGIREIWAEPLPLKNPLSFSRIFGFRGFRVLGF